MRIYVDAGEPGASLSALQRRGTAERESDPDFPGLTIVLIVLCINFVRDALRDALDPTQRNSCLIDRDG
jgi:hypothetical protein